MGRTLKQDRKNKWKCDESNMYYINICKLIKHNPFVLDNAFYAAVQPTRQTTPSEMVCRPPR